MDLAFITRSLRLTLLLALLGYAFATVYIGHEFGLGIALGALWGIGNLYLIRKLVERSIRPGARDWTAVAVLLLVKFPLLYGVGFLILTRPWYTPWAPVAGFSLSLAVIVLKAAGRALLGIEGPGDGRKPAGAKPGARTS